MTLCIAQRLGQDNIVLVSDSRITVGAKYFDRGIKIFDLPVDILMPHLEDESLEISNKGTLTFGLAVAGDTLHAYLVKDAVAGVLKNLYFIPDHTDLSIERICDLVKYTFTQLAQDIQHVRDKTLQTGFILTGYCPEKGYVRAFRFETKRSQFGTIGGEYTEILKKKHDIEFIGSGSKLGREVFEKHPSWPPLWVLDEVVRNKKDPTVGGRLQFGQFHGKFTFYISGVVYHELDENGKSVPKLFLRGIEIYDPEFIISSTYGSSQDFVDRFNPEYIQAWNNRHPDDQFHRE